ncbi:hypothetical protein [Mycobacterium sp.]|uniref:hypothetical protein n=1 Tax=Mycobacterium sp. TaxID=1785 RepID=UPI003F9B4CEF
MRVRIREDGDIKEPDYGVHIRVSGEYEVVHDRYLPTWLELTIEGHDGPNLFRRIEVRDGQPELVVMSWWSVPGQREIKQKDVRNLPVASILDEVYPAFVLRIDRDNNRVELAVGSDEMAARGESPQGFYDARSFIDQLRARHGNRVITPAFLQSVADVYRRNIDHAPTQAVARTFGVKSRMASTYVDLARRAGYLPPTKQGKKHA